MAITVATPGNIVVPLSEIIRQLQGRLTRAEIDALLDAVVSQRRERVGPGDLITAELMNQILADLADLTARVTRLEGSASTPGTPSTLTITRLVPDPPWEVDQQVEVRGANFGISTGTARVQFDGRPLTALLLGSSDTSLLFRVPALSGLGSGRDVVLTVTNEGQSATRTVRVNPLRQSQQGNVDVMMNPRVDPNPDPNPITTGSRPLIAYEVRSRALLPDSFTITVRSSNASIQSGSTVLDAQRRPLADNRVELAPGQTAQFFVQLPEVRVAANGTFTLTVSAAGSGRVAGSDERSFTVGERVTPEDDTIAIAFDTLSATTGTGAADPTANYTAADRTVHLRAGSIGTLTLLATFTQTGTYDVTLANVGAAGWTAGLANRLTQYVIERSDMVNGVASRNPEIGIVGQAGAADGRIRLTIRRRGAANERAEQFNLSLLP